MSDAANPVLVVVLAGGDGRRIGGDKPIRVFGDGRLIDRALELAHSYSPDVAVSLRSNGQVPDLDGVMQLIDDPAVAGPMAGLKAGLDHARNAGFDRVLTLPCDTPFLPPDLLERLDTGLGGKAVAAASSGGRLHSACALWRVAGLAAMGEQIALGDFSLRRLAERAGMQEVEWTTEAGDPFSNANTPEELEALCSRLVSRPANAD